MTTRLTAYDDHHLNGLSELFIWPHAGCNARCVMCDIWQDRSRRELSHDDIERWSDEWQRMGITTVILTGGEALMHSNIFSVTAALRRRGMAVLLLSTGILLKRHAEEIALHVDVINVSLDGPPAVHDLVRRVPNAFRLLAEGCAAVRAVRPDLRIIGRCTVNRHNFRQLRETVWAAKNELVLNRLSFISSDLTSDAFNREGGWDAARQATVAIPADGLDDLAAEVEALIDECATEFADGFIIESPDTLRARLVQYAKAFHGQSGYPAVACDVPWGSAVIEVDGTVRPCFFHRAYGNIHDSDSLETLVNSPQAVEFRRSLDVTTDATCRTCVCPRTLNPPVQVPR